MIAGILSINPNRTLQDNRKHTGSYTTVPGSADAFLKGSLNACWVTWNFANAWKLWFLHLLSWEFLPTATLRPEMQPFFKGFLTIIVPS